MQEVIEDKCDRVFAWSVVAYVLSWFLPIFTARPGRMYFAVELVTVPFELAANACEGRHVQAFFLLSVAVVANAIPLVLLRQRKRKNGAALHRVLWAWLGFALVACIALCVMDGRHRPSFGPFVWWGGLAGMVAAVHIRYRRGGKRAWRSAGARRRIGLVPMDVFTGYDPLVPRLMLDAAELRRALTRDPEGHEAIELAYAWAAAAERLPATARDELQRIGADVRRVAKQLRVLWQRSAQTGLAAARLADDALWMMLAAVARNTRPTAYR